MTPDYFAFAVQNARQEFKVPETDEDRREREQRELNDEIFTEAIRRWFAETEPRR